MSEYKFAATCLFGLEGFLGEEIDSLGYKRTETIDGRVFFEGDETAIARANINLRTAERLFLIVREFDVTDFDTLFEQTKRAEWEEYLPENAVFPVTGHSIKSKLFSVPDCQKIVKKAISTRLGSYYKKNWLEETGDRYKIEFFILKDHAYIMIDCSGDSLHKRGYRPESTTAPLRETLAAAMVKISRPRENVLFWDPMCGSATIAIEAALIMTNTAPGLHRHFDAEKFGFVDKKVWNNAFEEAKNAVVETQFEAYASDIDENAVQIAKQCVKNAGMEKYIKVFRQDALKIETGGRRGTVVCNPPYGERLVSLKEAERLYINMGRHFATLDNWQIYVLTNNENFEKLFNRKADKKRKLYNGMIPCIYYQFYKKQEQKGKRQ